ncbi:hypothetical protein [Bacillus thuringiensis]|uniref:hypothetical protein n=1 Tax=Bacillus thuringiensis TaxID=1428 RepID=UPI000BFC6307|nr:hypothetical protein [Bacillus thuringiensis]PGM50474.1 hypothetical protein CN949_18060 [Bacillus thuringiensis]
MWNWAGLSAFALFYALYSKNCNTEIQSYDSKTFTSWVVGHLIALESHSKAGAEEIFMLAY